MKQQKNSGQGISANGSSTQNITDVDTEVLCTTMNMEADAGIHLDTTAIPDLEQLERFYEVTGDAPATNAPEISREATDKRLLRRIELRSLTGAALASPEMRKAFLSEAQLLAQLDHPAIVPLYDLCTDRDGGLHLAMRRTSGRTLMEYLNKLSALYAGNGSGFIRRAENRSLPRRLGFFLRACEAMEYAHSRGMIHNNLRPEHILVGNHGEVYLSGWSKASLLRDTTPRTPPDSVDYAAPEMLERHQSDCRSDIYSLGLILFHLVCLQPPFSDMDDDPSERIKAHELRDIHHRFDCRLSALLTKIIAKATAFYPDDRYQSVKSLREDIAGFLRLGQVSVETGGPVIRVMNRLARNRKLMLRILAAAVLLLCGSATLHFYREYATSAANSTRLRLMSELQHNAVNSALRFNRQINNYREQLKDLASETALLLSAPATDTGRKEIFDYRITPATLPPGYRDSRAYRQKVSLDCIVVKPPRGAVREVTEEYCRRLGAIRGSLYRLISGSLSEEQRGNRSAGELKSFLINDQKAPVSFIQISLRDGHHFSFPFHADYNEEYDPRKREWYRMALSSGAGETSWTKPYIDNGELGNPVFTGVHRVLNAHGELLGCVSIDISLNALVELLAVTGNSGSAVIDKLLLTPDGSIISDVYRKHVPLADRGELRFDKFSDSELFQQITAAPSGMIWRREGKRDYFYFYMKIDSLGWIYLEKIDCDAAERASQP